MVWYLKPWSETQETFIQSLLLPTQINVLFLSLFLFLISAVCKLLGGQNSDTCLLFRTMEHAFGGTFKCYYDCWVMWNKKKKEKENRKENKWLLGSAQQGWFSCSVDAHVFPACGWSRWGAAVCLLAVLWDVCQAGGHCYCLVNQVQHFWATCLIWRKKITSRDWNSSRTLTSCFMLV